MVRSRPAAGREIRGHRDRQQIPGVPCRQGKDAFQGAGDSGEAETCTPNFGRRGQRSLSSGLIISDMSLEMRKTVFSQPLGKTLLLYTPISHTRRLK